jgi:tetratricopeptide (TPR) repeat protein
MVVGVKHGQNRVCGYRSDQGPAVNDPSLDLPPTKICRPTKEEFVIAMSRREKIEAMLTEDPSDTFLRYSLAMELRSEGDYPRSLAQLADLTQDDPPMVAAFFMAGQLLAELDRIDEAREQLRNGIDQARRQGDAHAAAEMSDLLASLGELGEL